MASIMKQGPKAYRFTAIDSINRITTHTCAIILNGADSYITASSHQGALQQTCGMSAVPLPAQADIPLTQLAIHRYF
jgi:hypothetical protein